MTIKISKTTYNVENTETLEGGSICYTLRAGKSKTTKSLVGKPESWFLWSCRNGMNNLGMPKPVNPIFDVLQVA